MKISEYLEQALQDGYPWAQAALDNFNLMSVFEDDINVESLHEAVVWAFVWSETPQGLDHWHTVWQEVRSLH